MDFVDEEDDFSDSVRKSLSLKGDHRDYQKIGDVIVKNKLDRKKLLILTKCFGTVGETPSAMHSEFCSRSQCMIYFETASQRAQRWTMVWSHPTSS